MKLILLLAPAIFGLILGQDYTCTSSGRFRYSDVTCRSYYLCMVYNGAYVKSNYTCPSTMMFNPTSQTCVSNMTCIESVCAGLPLFPLYPKVPDPNGQDCRTYIQCLGYVNKYPVVLTCPNGMYFNQAQNNGTGECWPVGNCTIV